MAQINPQEAADRAQAAADVARQAAEAAQQYADAAAAMAATAVHAATGATIDLFVLHQLGYECEKTVAGERATHLMLRKRAAAS